MLSRYHLGVGFIGNHTGDGTVSLHDHTKSAWQALSVLATGIDVVCSGCCKLRGLYCPLSIAWCVFSAGSYVICIARRESCGLCCPWDVM